MSEISEISSSPEDQETSEREEEDVEVIYSQIRPYQDEPLAGDAEENTEENEVDDDGLTPAAALEARYEREVPVYSGLVYSIFYRRLVLYAVIPDFKLRNHEDKPDLLYQACQYLHHRRSNFNLHFPLSDTFLYQA